jgi:Methyltransferase domain
MITDDVWELIEKQWGWCWREKADLIYRLAQEPQVLVGVEVGVWGGRSLLPLCIGVLRKGGGRVYGFDPYGEYPPAEGEDPWWNRENRDKVKSDAERFLKNYGNWVDIIHRVPSVEASKRFDDETVDYIHIDGDHAAKAVMEDVEAWCPKMKKGGYMLFDDTGGAGVRAAINAIKKDGYEFLLQLAYRDYPPSTELWRKPA